MVIKSIVEILNLSEFEKDPKTFLELIEDEIIRCKNSGDHLGAGEWLISKLRLVNEDKQVEEIFSQVLALWGSPLELKVIPYRIEDLNIDEFIQEDLAVAFVAVALHLQSTKHTIPQKARDLSFRLSSSISKLFEIPSRRTADIYIAASAKLETIRRELFSSVDFFTNTNCLNAKPASIEIIKKIRPFKKIAIAAERPILNDVELLLGSAFRKFCEHCERQETKDIIKRIPDVKEQAQRFYSPKEPRLNSVPLLSKIGQVLT